LGASYLFEKKYLLTDINFGGNFVTVPAIIPTSNFSLQAQLPVFDGFATTERVEASRANESAGDQEFEWTRFQTEREVSLQFYRAVAAAALKEVAQQNVKTLSDHLKDVKLFKSAGLSTNYDVLRVEVQVSEANSELMSADDNQVIARNKLAELLGLESDDREIKGSLPVLEANLIPKEPDTTATARLDLQAVNSHVKAIELLESSAAKHFVPRIYLFGQYQIYNNKNDRLFDSDSYRSAYQAGVGLSWNLFDGMASIARSRESVEQRFQNEKMLQMARLKAHQDVDLWTRKFSYFCSIYKSRLSDIEKAGESVRLAREGRKAGTRTNTDLLDAETELFRAKAGAVNAQLNSVESLINLELATGKNYFQSK
jgi:outer membrane protein TolC